MFIVLGAVVTVVLAMTALTLVQRVQADPLQVERSRWPGCRLTAHTSSHRFSAMSQTRAVEAFQEFYGLRTVASFGAGDWSYNGGSGIA